MLIRRWALRLWIAGGSAFTFLVGLAMLAHAPKPVQAGSDANQIRAVAVGPPLQTLVPMAPLDFSGYFSAAGAPPSQFTIQERPTAAPQPQISAPQAPITSPQQTTPAKKRGKAAKQQDAGGGQESGLSTGGS